MIKSTHNRTRRKEDSGVLQEKQRHEIEGQLRHSERRTSIKKHHALLAFSYRLDFCLRSFYKKRKKNRKRENLKVYEDVHYCICTIISKFGVKLEIVAVGYKEVTSDKFHSIYLLHNFRHLPRPAIITEANFAPF